MVPTFICGNTKLYFLQSYTGPTVRCFLSKTPMNGRVALAITSNHKHKISCEPFDRTNPAQNCRYIRRTIDFDHCVSPPCCLVSNNLANHMKIAVYWQTCFPLKVAITFPLVGMHLPLKLPLRWQHQSFKLRYQSRGSRRVWRLSRTEASCSKARSWLMNGGELMIKGWFMMINGVMVG